MDSVKRRDLWYMSRTAADGERQVSDKLMTSVRRPALHSVNIKLRPDSAALLLLLCGGLAVRCCAPPLFMFSRRHWPPARHYPTPSPLSSWLLALASSRSPSLAVWSGRLGVRRSSSLRRASGREVPTRLTTTRGGATKLPWLHEHCCRSCTPSDCCLLSQRRDGERLPARARRSWSRHVTIEEELQTVSWCAACGLSSF